MRTIEVETGTTLIKKRQNRMHDKARFYKFCQRVSIETGNSNTHAHTHAHSHRHRHTHARTYRDPLCWNGNGYEAQAWVCVSSPIPLTPSQSSQRRWQLCQRLVKIDEATYGRF